MLEESSSNKRRRTSEDFLAFCRIILDYENYEEGVEPGRGRKRMHKNGIAEDNEKGVLAEEDERDDSKSNSSGSSSDGRDKDGFNEVTCYCRKPFAGRPMIECSSCLTWVHLSCAKIKRTHIPDTWNCSKCNDKLSSSGPNGKRSSRKRRTSPSKMNLTPL